jgi:hypothetical protein
MKKNLIALAMAGLIALPVFAQSNSTEKPHQEGTASAMKCPMMGMGDKSQAMPQPMAGMFAMSSEEVAKVLAEKKDALGLSDAQVKSLADLVASAQQQKVGEKMKSMMSQMQAGEKCSCIESEKK